MKITLITLLLTLCFSLHAQVIKNAWVKRPIPGVKLTGAYMVIENPSDKEVKLIGIEGPDADYYEIHTHENVKGVMKMRQLKNLSIAAKGSVTLEPKSFHIMLIQIKKNRFMKKEDKTQMTLTFSNGKKKTVLCKISDKNK